MSATLPNSSRAGEAPLERRIVVPPGYDFAESLRFAPLGLFWPR